MPGFKTANGYISLLFCADIKGDFRCKLLLLHCSIRLCVLRIVSLTTLPVIWSSNKKGCRMIKKIFEDWFKKIFSLALELNYNWINISHKALLLLNSCSGLPTNVNGLQDNVEVCFLPPYTTSMLQPLDLDMMSTFKLKYLQHAFRKLHETVSQDEGMGGNNTDDKCITILDRIHFIG